ncbi:dTDP-glucose 4,6-dehydratase 2 [Posidoniimonas corsicana]|uniref:dTDP-glucose 4,6-dehydratase n=1 Tax=Posidoniimonas corsicana TaxID=1938618 RepID=A0A5C5V7L0_9BACT|nr:dTDP-glucose 4,6-dehydratase [Posidoniimonas corsicana]TWT33963.1 dTDP-glucose 4,6-dehydratase 2 [Posidoniimonas corsicana]
MPTLLITGGAGFVGANLVRVALESPNTRVVVLDKLTYAGRKESLPGAQAADRLIFVKGDINDGPLVRSLLSDHQPDAVVHLAAESHVDRSIDAPAAFVDTNVGGTSTLLLSTLGYWEGLTGESRGQFRFVHASTDEVFGSLDPEGRFTEESPYRPNSPYSASKAASDHLVRAFHRTYGLPTVTCHSSNNYGPYQHPEKLIPTIILNALAGAPLPVYGDGLQVRDWLHVADHSRALLDLAARGQPGGVYLAGADNEQTNLDVVRRVCRLVDELSPPAGGKPRADLIRHVEDRPGHDRRYALDAGKIRSELGWAPSIPFDDGVRETVAWYLANPRWIEIAVRKDGLRRLGLRQPG